MKSKGAKYKVIAKIDEGSFGDIFKILRYDDPSHDFVLKQILYRGDPMKDEVIKAEVDSLTSLQHTNIIKLYDILITPSDVNLILEFAECGNLCVYLSNNFPLPDDTIRKFCGQILRALNFCHSNNIAHRDVTPANILVNKDNDIKLADFGLSYKISNSNLCTDFTGCVRFQAPEVLREEPYDAMTSDLWSLGVLFYFLVFHRYLFSGCPESVIEQQTRFCSVDTLVCDKDNSKMKFLVCKVIRHLVELEPRARLSLTEVCDKFNL